MAASDRRAELLEAAIRVMTRDGVAKATTRAIVNEAGMPLGVFHYCFDSREQLLEVVTQTLTERYVAEARALFTPHREIRDSILDSLHAFWKGFEANPREHQISYELTQYALRNPGFENVARRQYEIFLSAFASLLDLAADNAGIEWTVPVPVLARYVQSTIDGLNITWLVDRNSDDSQAALELLADHLLQHTRPREA
ncbi:TetR/AcrR family transcriptional regulator [Streptomyces sp. NBC_00487]|uniref:TetR/AcrR family transcriptional regulator n=1 Tax=unclassified Streptomyces TaxID=2593676 RepID=UPI002DDB7C96|nr:MULTISPECIES: TetR/AcrR family transcriptional regulator [unclassified Streptomyces]WRZ01792.1 TetR/AcrR family transcriptional regulator [Streptomyces sp. NBC_00481]